MDIWRSKQTWNNLISTFEWTCLYRFNDNHVLHVKFKELDKSWTSASRTGSGHRTMSVTSGYSHVGDLQLITVDDKRTTLKLNFLTDSKSIEDDVI